VVVVDVVLPVVLVECEDVVVDVVEVVDSVVVVLVVVVDECEDVVVDVELDVDCEDVVDVLADDAVALVVEVVPPVTCTRMGCISVPCA
jgi:hypothetical protein